MGFNEIFCSGIFVEMIPTFEQKQIFSCYFPEFDFQLSFFHYSRSHFFNINRSSKKEVAGEGNIVIENEMVRERRNQKEYQSKITISRMPNSKN